MIGKVMIGKSFGGCVRYNVEKQDAKILDAEGIRTENKATIINDFNLQRQLNENLNKAVGHIAISWSIQDKEKLNDNIMVEKAKEYMDKMNIKDTQYLIVQHNDKQHPHLHIIYNRVNNKGKTISDQFQKQRNGKVCKEMTLKHGYHMAINKAQVNKEQLKGIDQVKYELYDTITKTLKQTDNWNQLASALKEHGIETQYKYKSGTNEVQGVSFAKGDAKLKGSAIDRSLSNGRISQELKNNQKSNSKGQPIPHQPTMQHTYLKREEPEHNYLGSKNDWPSLTETLFARSKEEGDDGPSVPQKKKKKQEEHTTGLSL